MNWLAATLTKSPLIARIAPFAAFLLLTSCQSYFGQAGKYWLYLAKTVLAVWMLRIVWEVVSEMRWRVSWEAVVVGVSVFGVWVGLDGIVPDQRQLWVKLGLSKAPVLPEPLWNPFLQFGNGSLLAWIFVAVRILGSSLVVPPLEEAFYRSFLYRWITTPDFGSVPFGQYSLKPFVLSAVIFGFAHNEWLAGILCATAYQGLVCRKKRLGDAMTAHAITNFLLGVWVVWKGAWHFW